MNARQKFWLKLFLTLTSPLWFFPAMLLCSAGMLLFGVWDLISEVTNDRTGPCE